MARETAAHRVTKRKSDRHVYLQRSNPGQGRPEIFNDIFEFRLVYNPGCPTRSWPHHSDEAFNVSTVNQACPHKGLHQEQFVVHGALPQYFSCFCGRKQPPNGHAIPNNNLRTASKTPPVTARGLTRSTFGRMLIQFHTRNKRLWVNITQHAYRVRDVANDLG
jgi:hypothetical protein